jgi:hypothetical protein
MFRTPSVSFNNPTAHKTISHSQATAVCTSDSNHPMPLLLLPTCLHRETVPSALQRLFVIDVITSWLITQL